MQSKRLHTDFKENRPLKVLVVFHIYYEEFVSYYLEKMKNICGCEWDLVITGSNLSEATRERITAFKSDAVFCETPNIGYDVWPFLYVIQNTDLNKYDFVIKLHTKNQDPKTFRYNGLKFNGEKWRSELVEVLLGSRKRFICLTDILCNHDKTGMAYSQSLDILLKDNLKRDVDAVDREMERLGLDSSCRHFCGGTMFAAKSDALKWIKNDKINIDLFDAPIGSHQTLTMAHVYERILSMAVVAEGYEIRLLRNSWKRSLHLYFKRNIQPCLEWIFSIDYCDGKKKVIVLGNKF